MRQSEAINELASALAKAQAKIEGAVKATLNPHFRSQYADLGNVWAAIREPLTSNGLSVVQLLRGVERGVECETMMMHASGQFLAETLFMPANKIDAQGYGSACTYARRYGLQAMVGIAPVDDDGNGARDKGGDNEHRDPPPPKPPANGPKSVERGTPLADARREIDAGTASTVEQVRGRLTGQADAPMGPKEWANSMDAHNWIQGEAVTTINAIGNPKSLGEWQQANRESLEALDLHAPKRHGWLMNKINERLDYLTNLRAAG